MKIKVLYEDSNILAIDKLAGISVHADGRSKEKTITDWVLKNYPKMKNVGEPMGEIARPGIVHRLDKETSGVLLLAKNQKTHAFLKNQFINREIKKTYISIVDGWVKNDRGIINKPIGRSPKDFRRYLSGRGARGEMREAITQYKVLKRFTASSSLIFSPYVRPSRIPRSKKSKTILPQKYVEKFTLLEIKPKTGRTHQIRVHMKYLNHPIVCDSLYNPNTPCPKGIKRLALHAKSIEFSALGGSVSGGKGKMIKIESPLPKEFVKITGVK